MLVVDGFSKLFGAEGLKVCGFCFLRNLLLNEKDHCIGFTPNCEPPTLASNQPLIENQVWTHCSGAVVVHRSRCLWFIKLINLLFKTAGTFRKGDGVLLM